MIDRRALLMSQCMDENLLHSQSLLRGLQMMSQVQDGRVRIWDILTSFFHNGRK